MKIRIMLHQHQRQQYNQPPAGDSDFSPELPVSRGFEVGLLKEEGVLTLDF